MQIDSILLPFVHTGDETEARQHLNDLIAYAAPDIVKITRASRAPEDAFQETAHRVIRQLRQLRAGSRSDVIGNYSHYVRVLASHVVKGQVREKHPMRKSLADSLRHVLNRDPRLASWDSNGHRLCGLGAWRERQLPRVSSGRLIRLLDAPLTVQDIAPVETLGHPELLRILFNWLGHPIRFDELIKIVCGLKQIDSIEPRFTVNRDITDPARRPDHYAEWREFLQTLWAQLERLPRLHRLAYLLNFTAADGHLELFWAHKVATIGQIGAALQITNGEFARAWEAISLTAEMQRRSTRCERYNEKFALLWQLLPLPDAVIAHMLRIDRQKVINLRKAASARLSREILAANS